MPTGCCCGPVPAERHIKRSPTRLPSARALGGEGVAQGEGEERVTSSLHTPPLITNAAGWRSARLGQHDFKPPRLWPGGFVHASFTP